MEKLIEIMSAHPVLTLILGFALAVLAMILFRAEIAAIIKTKYNLYSETEIVEKLQDNYPHASIHYILKLLKKP